MSVTTLTFGSSLYQRQLVELVERRRRRQRPFERGRARAPRIVARPLLAHEGIRHAEEEHQRAECRDERSDRRYVVPAPERIRVVGDAARHAGKSEEVLREEYEV